MLQRQKVPASFQENLTRQLTSLRTSTRDAAAKTLDKLSPEASLRILGDAIEKAYVCAQRRRPWMLAAVCASILMLSSAFLSGDWGTLLSFLPIFALLWSARLGVRTRLSDPQLQLVWRFNEQVKRTTLASAAGPILDVLRWPMNYPADRAILKAELKRLLALADDDTARGLTSAQLQTLAEILRPLDNPELGIVGLLTLASAHYADAELLKKTASLALTDAPLGLAAREYRRAVGEALG